MPDAPLKPPKIEALWSALLGSCIAAGYDFQKYKRSNPPDIDADPVIVDIADRKKAP